MLPPLSPARSPMHTPWPDWDETQEPPSQAWAVGRWLVRVAAWDGMLPVVVWSLPLVALQLFPGRRGPVELLGVVLPITAFLIRFFVGVRAIRTNHCGRLVRGLQGIALWAGLFLLLIVDTLQILRLVMPPNAFKDRESLIGFVVFYSIYIVCMAFAMYPGRHPALKADDPSRTNSVRRSGNEAPSIQPPPPSQAAW